MPGYSDRTLTQKLGLTPGVRSAVLHAPNGYNDILPGTPRVMRLTGSYDWVQAFYQSYSDLTAAFTTLTEHLLPSGQLWISWPKKSSDVKSDLDENVVRELGLANGVVDVKVVAIDDTWSGLKFVYRLVDRERV